MSRAASLGYAIIAAENANEALAGTQDNGTLRSSGYRRGMR